MNTQTTNKLCVYCNTVKPINEISNNGKSKRCKQCYNNIQQLKNNNIKLELIKYGGGECIRCGNNSIPTLQFHHINPNNKSFTIGNIINGSKKIKGHTYTLEYIKNEVDKCVILCANCHCEYHAGLFKIVGKRLIPAQ